jgi:hypothetical protein
VGGRRRRAPDAVAAGHLLAAVAQRHKPATAVSNPRNAAAGWFSLGTPGTQRARLHRGSRRSRSSWRGLCSIASCVVAVGDISCRVNGNVAVWRAGEGARDAAAATGGTGAGGLRGRRFAAGTCPAHMRLLLRPSVP